MRSLAIQNLLTSILSFVFLSSLLRLLSPIEYGVYSAVFVSTGLAIVVASAGLSTAATRFVALFAEGDETKAWGAARVSVILTVLLGVIASIIFLALSPFLSFYFTKTYDWTFAFLLGAIWIILATISNTLLGLVQGLKKYDLMAEMILLSRVALLIFTIAGLYIYNNVEIPIIAWIVNFAIVSLWSLKLTGGKMLSSSKYDGGAYSEVMRYAVPSGTSSIVNVVSNNADQVVVGGYLGSASLAIYSATVNISNVLALVLLSPLITAFLPETSSSLRRSEEVSNGLRLAIRFAIATIIPASFIVSGLASQLLNLFSGENVYLTGTLSLQLLSILFVFTALTGILNSLLLAIGRTLLVLMIGIATVSTAVGLSVALVPIFGIDGAALANALVGVVGFVVALPFVRQYLVSIKREYGFYLKVIIGSTASLVLIFALTDFVSGRVLTLIPYSISAALIFLAFLKVTNAVTDEDRRYLNHFIPSPINKIVDYF